ncbi:arsenite efflux transporter metallochaperone ArsD [Ancylomarina sp. YFZ004]
MIIEIFEPALCCSSGVCGPAPDKALIELQNTINLLKQLDVEVNRYAINQSPQAFINNPLVSTYIKENGVGNLPLTILDNKIIQEQKYPSLDEINKFIPGLKALDIKSKISGIYKGE